MFIHDIRVEQGTIYPGDDSTQVAGTSIVVGATDPQRWYLEIEAGRRGADAKTLVWVELKIPSACWATTETIGLHVDRDDPLRAAALAAVSELLQVAWEISDAGWDLEVARAAVYGRRIRGASGSIAPTP